MKWLLLLFLGIIVFPAFAQNATISQMDYQKLENDINTLKDQHAKSDIYAQGYAIIGFTGSGLIALYLFIIQYKQGIKIERIIDEQEKFRKEQRDFAINRVRSYLATLHSAIKSLMELDIDPNILYTKDFEIKYDFKNDMVAQLTHIVNQSGSILEQDYLQRLTDIIELSRVNPKPFEADYGTALDRSYCNGILSQIDDLLKIMPNPPI